MTKYTKVSIEQHTSMGMYDAEMMIIQHPFAKTTTLRVWTSEGGGRTLFFVLHPKDRKKMVEALLTCMEEDGEI